MGEDERKTTAQYTQMWHNIREFASAAAPANHNEIIPGKSLRCDVILD
jgi:hypothetical protein